MAELVRPWCLSPPDPAAPSGGSLGQLARPPVLFQVAKGPSPAPCQPARALLPDPEPLQARRTKSPLPSLLRRGGHSAPLTPSTIKWAAAGLFGGGGGGAVRPPSGPSSQMAARPPRRRGRFPCPRPAPLPSNGCRPLGSRALPSGFPPLPEGALTSPGPQLGGSGRARHAGPEAPARPRWKGRLEKGSPPTHRSLCIPGSRPPPQGRQREGPAGSRTKGKPLPPPTPPRPAAAFARFSTLDRGGGREGRSAQRGGSPPGVPAEKPQRESPFPTPLGGGLGEGSSGAPALQAEALPPITPG